jgi:hypothetical protein
LQLFVLAVLHLRCVFLFRLATRMELCDGEGPQEKTASYMPPLQGTLPARLPQRSTSTVLFGGSVPRGEQARVATALAVFAEGQRLLPWPGECGSCAAVAGVASGVLEAGGDEGVRCVTRCLFVASRCRTRGCSGLSGHCATRCLLHATRAPGWTYRQFNRQYVTRRHRCYLPTVHTFWPKHPGHCRSERTEGRKWRW